MTEKWSDLLRHFMSEYAKRRLRVVPKTDVGDNPATLSTMCL